MRILLIENEAGAADRIGRTLTAAGHDIVRCHLAGDADDVCVFLQGRALCPLHVAPVDATIDVRCDGPDGGSAGLGARELGAYCAVRDNVPLIVVGPADAAVFPWSDALAVCDPADVAERLQTTAPVIPKTGTGPFGPDLPGRRTLP